MESIKEAFEMVLGECFIEEMLFRLLIIAVCLAALIALIIVLFVWKSVTCKKIRDAVLALSEYPDSDHASLFVNKIKALSGFGKALAKTGRGYADLSKGDCRVIFNSTVLPSHKIDADLKKEVRACLMAVGCTGLTDVDVG